MTRWILAALLLMPLAPAAQGPLAGATGTRETVGATPEADLVAQALASVDAFPGLAALYAERDHARIWTHPGSVRLVLARLEEARFDGLTDEYLDAASIRMLAASGADGALRDVLLTDAVLRLTHALLGRRVDPETVHRGHWHLTPEARTRRALDPADVLREPLAADDPARATLAALRALQPRHAEYHALRQRLRDALAVDLSVIGPASTRREDTDAVYPDVPRQRRDAREIALLRLNLERWRWLPADFGAAHVLVNVPAARLMVREAPALTPSGATGTRPLFDSGARPSQIVLEMDATVGQPEPDWQTPVLSDPIRSVSFFPTWTPTVTIQRREIIPEARLDGGADLYARGFTVSRGGRTFDPREVDWDRARAGQYRIVQRGGPLGELGRVKFVMPNRHWILIHDTNTPEEFDDDERALSHGCVRAADPGALADAILARTNGWDAGRASGIIAGHPRSRGVRLRERFPVHIVYFTAWPSAEDASGVAYHDDVYGRDRELAAALGLALPDAGLPARGQNERSSEAANR